MHFFHDTYITSFEILAILVAGRIVEFKLGFPTGRDSTTFWDNGTEVSSLSQEKGTMGQAQNRCDQNPAFQN